MLERMWSNIKEFIQIYNKTYITIKDLKQLRTLYNCIKKKRHLSIDERCFLRHYKGLDKLVEEKNNKYLTQKRKNTTLLDSIKGYPLDEYQSRVVLSEEEASLVIAGAGSGKSLTIIGKIIYLIKEKKLKPEDILCISLTNDATNNLQKNIYDYYKINIEVLTFHKLALKILQENNEYFSICPEDTLEAITDMFIQEYISCNKMFKKAYKFLLNTYKEEYIKKTIITFINLFKSNNYKLAYFKKILSRIKLTIRYKEYKKNKYFLLLIINIYLSYQKELEDNNLLDFNDMINKSINSLKVQGIKRKYKYIIIDEYQDTSLLKVKMIQEIIKHTNSKLLVVGDDFQSIYRFTGCDLQVFLNFSQYFNNSKIFKIINTYRNPQELIDISGHFIMRNNYQIKKELKSSFHLSKPVKVYYTNNHIKTLKEILSFNKETIFVLGRNNKDINYYVDDNYIKLDNNYYKYNNTTFRYLTIHKSKGLEADNIIIININNNYNSLPSKIRDEKLLKYVKCTKEYYPYDEERRLFYVALTRTKNYVYIITPYNNESVFIKEIKKYKDVEIIRN